jgi:gliding motility-associated-like protein
MRIVPGILVLLLLNFGLTAQNWIYTAGSTKEDETTDICYDNNGNIISTGYFSGLTTFYSPTGNTLNSAASGSADMYISKATAAGQVLWTKKAGGLGSDKALSVKADATGNIYITGFYYGTAAFGSITLTSISGGQDGFIAKLDASGNFLWAKSFGGSLSEQGNSITVDNLGYPVITGQFQGAANFGGTVLTSMINPGTGFSSSDVFVAKYTPTGLLDWANQGKAKYDDKGLDILTDPSNNIYVCGQFSDTIQFQNTYTNTIQNACFLVKYNATGQEQWFRKMAGVFSIPYSMVMDNANKIYVTGDFQGTLTYFGASGNSFVSGTYPNKAFLVKVDNSGTFVWGRSESSTSYVSSKRVALDAQQDPYLFGEFGCTMTEYSDAYGPGVFNSVGFKDLFITKYSNSGTRQWFRQYGGPMNEKAQGLLVAGINQPVMAGSYETRLVIPATNSSLIPINTLFSGSDTPIQPAGYCSAPNNYTQYSDVLANGYSDMFLFKGIDLSRNPYDYYQRSGSLCDLGFVGNCINCITCAGTSTLGCQDTVMACGGVNIGSLTHANTYDPASSYTGIGPIHTYIWNNNPNDSLNELRVIISGVNTVSVTTLDGCYSSTASVYVKINPLPPAPVITDSEGINVLQPPATTPIKLCGTHTITLTGGNAQNTYGWTGPYISTHDSVAVIDTSGIYSFFVTNQFGCMSQNNVPVTFENPIAGFTPKQVNDTVKVCQGEYGSQIVCDSTSNPLMIYPYNCLNYTSSYTVSTSPGLTVFSNPPCDLSNSVLANATGNYTYTMAYVVHNSCSNDTVLFTGHVYIYIRPVPSGNITLTGGGLICPGDSTAIVLGNVTIFSPNTIYTVSQPGPIWMYGSGTAGYGLYMTDTVSHCLNTVFSFTTVTVKPDPFIVPYPSNAIICPNDSITMAVNLTGALNYEWHGPGGILLVNTQSIRTGVSGLYYCVVTDNTGCLFTTAPIEIQHYASPYLLSSPTSVICNHQPISLHVITLDSTMIFWGSPLFGTGATKLISNPGVYFCNVTMCGITSVLSITVTGSNPTASITATGPTTICPFDSVILHAGPTGMSTYNWQPVNYSGMNYTAHDPGDYILEVMDTHGCTATASINVALAATVPPPTLAVNDTICSGQAATLSATASGGNTLDWFYNNSSGPVVHSGNPYITPPLNSQTTYYAASVNTAGCHSTGVPVTAFIYNTSFMPVLFADTSVCSGDTLKITGPVINGASYQWSGPGVNNVTTYTLGIPNAGVLNSGTYSLSVSGFGCTSATSTVSITVVNVAAPILAGTDSICSNTFYSASVNPADPNSTYHWEGPNGFTVNNDSLVFSPAQPNQSGTYFVTSNQLGCVSDTSTITIVILQTPATPVITSNSPVCIGDSIHFSLNPASAYPVTWLGPNGFSSHQNPLSIYAPTKAPSGIYSVSLRNLFCQGGTATHSVQVLEYPVLCLSNDTVACEEEPLNLYGYSNYPYYVWNTGATSAGIAVSQSGVYVVSAANGRCAVSDTVIVDMVPCSLTAPNIFTPNGDGSNDFFFLRSAGIKEVYCEIWDRWGLKMAEFSGPENGWNGWNMYTNKPCSDGTYFYIASVTNIAGVQKSLRGFITLVR